jgi:polysaccharide pyruvyl transferase WcaK-like protein
MAQQLSAQIPGLEITVFSNQPEFTQAYMEDIFPVDALSQRYQLLRVLQALVRCDLFIIGGGTPFYDDWFHLVAMLLLVVTTRLAGNPVITYAVSVRPIQSKFSRVISKLILSMVGKVTVREPLAKDFMVEFGVKNPGVFIDPAVTIYPAESLLVETYLTNLGIDLSKPLFAVCPHIFQPAFSYHIHHYEKFSAESIERHHHLLARCADFLSAYGQVLFVPFNTENPDDDRLTNKRVQSLMADGGQTFQVQDQLSPQFIAGILKHCDMVMAVRFHAAVLASAMQTPLVAISYGPKIEGYMKHIGLGNYVIGFDDQDDDIFLAMVEETYQHLEGIREILSITIPQMRNLARQNASMVADYYYQHEFPGGQ